MIYLCRHGETAFNREHRLQGRMDSPLTTLGVRQAGAMADLLADLLAQDPSAAWRIMSSPQSRARATADIIAKRLALPVELDDRLMEISVGEWEGRVWADLARDFPERVALPGWHFDAPGGERYDDVMGRVSDWLSAQTDDAEQRLIVVSHGVTGRMLRGAYAGLTRDDVLAQDVPQDAIYRLSGGQLTRLECEPLD